MYRSKHTAHTDLIFLFIPSVCISAFSGLFYLFYSEKMKKLPEIITVYGGENN